MTFVLDTSVLIAIERHDKQVIEQLRKLCLVDPMPAKISFVTQFEFLLGLQEKNTRNTDKLLEFLNKFAVLQTTKTTAHILAQLKHAYDKKGIQLSLADLLIASLVIENNMTLLTRDTDFETITELKKIVMK